MFSGKMNHVQKQIDQLLALRASQWFEILKSADDSERAAFVEWLRESRRHVQEFLEIVATDRELGALDPQHEEDVERLLAKVAPAVIALEVPRPALNSGLHPRPPKTARLLAALAAGLALLTLGTGLVLHFVSPKHEFATAVGEQRTLQLADQSVVLLNVDSQIKVELGSTQRTVELLRGEAFFNVTHDITRPFQVRTRTGLIKVLGTKFNIDDRPEGIRVSVLDGRVALQAGSGQVSAAVAREEAIELGAGQEALIGPDGQIRREHIADVQRAMAWQHRRLIFDGASLEEVAREFNRYNRATQIRLQDVPTASHHYDGIFDADDLSSLVALLSHESDLMVERRAGEIVVRKR